MKTSTIGISLFCFVLLCAGSVMVQNERPVTPTNTSASHGMQAAVRSADGKFVAEVVLSQEGEAAVVIRNLQTQVEWRQPLGAKPGSATPITIAFTPDNKSVLFSTFSGGMGAIELATGKSTRRERIKNFQVAEKVSPAGAFVLFLREPEKAAAGRHYGSELVLWNLDSGEELQFPNVTEYLLAKDGSGFVYAVSSRDSVQNGVYAVFPDLTEVPGRLLNGPGKYANLTFDEQQKRLAFVSDRDPRPPASGQAPPQPSLAQPLQFRLYLWQRGTAAALGMVPASSAPAACMIDDKGTIAFSRDGLVLYDTPPRCSWAMAEPAAVKPK